MEKVRVSASTEYTVHIGSGFLDTIGEKIKEIKRLCRVVLVSDDTVFSLYGDKVKKSLTDSGYSVCEYVFSFPLIRNRTWWLRNSRFMAVKSSK